LLDRVEVCADFQSARIEAGPNVSVSNLMAPPDRREFEADLIAERELQRRKKKNFHQQEQARRRAGMV